METAEERMAEYERFRAARQNERSLAEAQARATQAMITGPYSNMANSLFGAPDQIRTAQQAQRDLHDPATATVRVWTTAELSELLDKLQMYANAQQAEIDRLNKIVATYDEINREATELVIKLSEEMVALRDMVAGLKSEASYQAQYTHTHMYNADGTVRTEAGSLINLSHPVNV
jgi:hypothetical protein